MSQFYLIAGTGHCGTKWLAEALDQPNAGIVCAHEGKVPKPVNWRSHLKKIGPLAKLWSRYRGRFRSFQGTNPWLEYQEYEMENGIGPKYRSLARVPSSSLRIPTTMPLKPIRLMTFFNPPVLRAATLAE